MPDTISFLSAHARAHTLLARLRATGVRCRVWLTGDIRRLEERTSRISVLVSGEMPLSEGEIGPGFEVLVAEAGSEGWAMVETTGGAGFLTEMQEARAAAGLPWPLPPGKGERELIEETFGHYVPPWLRSDPVDRSDPPATAGDMLVVPRVITAPSSAKSEVMGYLDAIGGCIFVADDGGPVASLLALLRERLEDPRIKLSTVVSGEGGVGGARGEVVIFDATSFGGDGDRIRDELRRIHAAAGRPVLLLNPTGRRPANDMLGNDDDVDAVAACCAELACPLLVCGHPARLGPGDDVVSAFLSAGSFIALGSGGGRADRCRFGLDCATAMAARAGAKPRDIWRPPSHTGVR